MTGPSSKAESVEIRRISDFYNLELLAARYTNHAFPRHWHETFVLEVVVSGVDEFYCRGSMHVAPPGSIIVINPGEVHSGHPSGRAALLYRCLYPTVALMRDVAAQFAATKGTLPYFPRPVIWDPLLAKEIRAAHECLLNESAPSTDGHNLLSDCLAKLIYSHSVPMQASLSVNEKAAVTRAKQFIIENYYESITLNQLAAISAISPYYLLRMFRGSTGLPPYEFLLSVRVERAKEQLSKGKSIAETAYNTGFYDQSHLTRHFKHIRGLTPGQYSKSIRLSGDDVN